MTETTKLDHYQIDCDVDDEGKITGILALRKWSSADSEWVKQENIDLRLIHD